MELQQIVLLLFASVFAVTYVHAETAAIEKCLPEKLKDVMTDLPPDKITIHPSGNAAKLYRGQGSARIPKVAGEQAYIDLDLRGRNYNLAQVGIDGNMQTISVKVKVDGGQWRTPRYEANEWIAQADFYDNGARADYLRIVPGQTYDPAEGEYRATLRVMVCEE